MLDSSVTVQWKDYNDAGCWQEMIYVFTLTNGVSKKRAAPKEQATKRSKRAPQQWAG